MAKRRLKSSAAFGFGNLAGAIVAVGLLFGFQGCKVGPIGPGPNIDPTAKATHCVAIIDATAPTIPQTLVLDNDQSRALKVAGKMPVVDINEPDPNDPNKKYVDTLDYTPHIGACGGAPCLLCMDEDNTVVIPARLPTDQASFKALLAKHFVNVPPPLPTVKPGTLFAVRSRGSEIAVKLGADNIEYIETVDEDGKPVIRMLTAKSNPQLMGSLPKYGDTAPVFPRSQWIEVNRSNLFGTPEWILNQGSYSSCVGNGGAGALARARVLAGMKAAILSPAYLYAQINRGQDKGAIISEIIPALQRNGTAPFDLIGQEPIFLKQIQSKFPQAADEAKRFRLAHVSRCDTADELGSALQSGGVAVFGCMVGRNFNKFDEQGVAGVDPGPGNHCMMIEGMVKPQSGKHAGKWLYVVANSWGTSWGPFKNGYVYLSEEHLFGRGVMPDIVIIRFPTRDPKDPYAPPAAKRRMVESMYADN